MAIRGQEIIAEEIKPSQYSELSPSLITKESVELEELASNPLWKEMLYELVYSGGFDPWDIDIERLCGAYISKIKSLKRLSLHIPANVILVASVLLRLKAEAFKIGEVLEEEALVVSEESITEAEEIPPIFLAGRIPPKRKFTLEELTAALEEVFAKQKKREEKELDKKNHQLTTLSFPVSEFDIDREMQSLLQQIRKNVDSENMALFSQIVEGKNREQTIFSFIALLHLAQERLIRISQDTFFGEIFIELPSKVKVSREKTAGFGDGRQTNN
ncbi:MAG: segregation/condensation protein A [Candidatus Anstonellales archaeon]